MSHIISSALADNNEHAHWDILRALQETLHRPSGPPNLLPDGAMGESEFIGDVGVAAGAAGDGALGASMREFPYAGLG